MLETRASVYSRRELGEQTLEESTGLIIVGMHRSGTSALTGAMHSLGADAGHSSDLTGASVENQKGFFERRDVREICDALLHAAHADWWKVSNFEIGQVEQNQLEQQRQRFSRIVENLSKAKTWIIKEPRLCLLLPLLINLVPNPICILIYRNPIEVAKSLRTRNQISLQQGIALWEKYNWAALQSVKHLPCVVVSYHDLIADQATTLDSVVDQLVALGAKGLDRPKDSPDFIDRSLQRSVAEPEEMEMLTVEQRILWSFLERKAKPDGDFGYKPTGAQKFILQDLEYHFARHNKAGGGVDFASSSIRSSKVLKLAGFLDRIVFYLRSKIRG